jgi:hypothetical protein
MIFAFVVDSSEQFVETTLAVRGEPVEPQRRNRVGVQERGHMG